MAHGRCEVKSYFVLHASKELLGTLYLAILQARRLGQSQVWTDDLLEVRAKDVPLVRNVLNVDAPHIHAVVAVRRSDALHSQRSVEPGSALRATECERVVAQIDREVDALFREAEWHARLKLRLRSDRPLPVCTEAVRLAFRLAVDRAHSAGRRYATPIHLFSGLLSLSDCRAAEVMETLGVRPRDAQADIPEDFLKLEGTPCSAVIGFLRMLGQLAEPYPDAIRAATWTNVFARLARASYWRVGGFKPMILTAGADGHRCA
jgi:hypothetical protein